MPSDGPEPFGTAVPLDTNLPHIARVYDYWLGGKDNFAADRDLAEKFMRADPAVTAGVRSNRAFLGRAVHYLVAEAGIRQFLDIGTGIPTANNTHEVAQRADPSARVAYVDNDPIVLTHARALLASDPAGVTDYIDADLRDTGAILAAAARTLDFAQPIAVMLIGVLHCIPDEDHPGEIVATLMRAVAPGSHLALSHPAADIHAEEMAAGAAMMNQAMTGSITFRTRTQVAAFFGRLDLVEPGVVSTPQWRPGTGVNPRPLPGWVGVARKV
jgi:S-adenosyl methyltransferase